MTDFQQFSLPESLQHTLKAMNFVNPTPIQEQAIPHALEGRDILGSAQTGTGKTGAFGIPLVTKLLTSEQGIALVMTPTRELAAQVMTQLQAMLGKRSPVKTALLIGGDSMQKQLFQLKRSPRLLVGTPGRINDHLKRGSLKLRKTEFLVLDETDRMLDMGFSVQIDTILEAMGKTRQTMLFSATLPRHIVTMSQKYLNDPVRISVSAESSPAENIKHDVIRVTKDEKYSRLLTELKERDGSVIIFVKMKHNADRLAEKLESEGHTASAIHGDLRQNKRDRVIKSFRNKKYRILVATDIAARGLDIPHIEHVINYDLPQCAEDYIHRIGRTARGGATGEAICLVTPSDTGKWKAIYRLMYPDAPQEHTSGQRKKRSSSSRPSRPSSSRPSSKPSSSRPGSRKQPSGKPYNKKARPPKADGRKRSKPKFTKKSA